MSFLRHGKNSGIDADFSSAISNDFILLDDLTRYGIRGKVSALAYDPIQSLLAVGTSDDGHQHGQVHVFGQGRIQVTFTLNRKSTVRHLRLHDHKLIVVDSANELSIYDLAAKDRVAAYSPPGSVSVILTDPSMDWIFLGLQTGEVMVYDADRLMLAPFRIPNLWRELNPKSRLLPVVSLALHPRDLGTLLIGYLEGAAVFSLKQNKAVLSLHFELPPGAPGADVDPSMVQTLRRPRLSTALWHPTGTFIMTGYEDSCMAFWDPKDGKLLQARTLQDSDVHLAGGQQSQPWKDIGGTFSVRQPFFKIAWCCGENPDETSLLVAGGNSVSMAAKGLTLFELGPTPSMVTSSYQLLAEHFGSPRRQRVLPTPPQDDVIDFVLINRTSPHYAGSHDPMAILALLSSGELITLSYPDGSPISSTSVFHVSLAMVQPAPVKLNVSSIKRERWLGMVETKDKPPQFLKGGAALKRVNKRLERRELAYTVHDDGTIRIFDLGHNDEIENPDCIEIELSKGLNRLSDLQVSSITLSYDTGELAVGMETGELLIYRWGRNKFYRSSGFERGDDARPGELRDISNRADPRVKESLLPLSLVENTAGPVKAVAVSDVGFIAAGYENGSLCVIDMRGPAVIFFATVQALSKESKRSSLRRSSAQPQGTETPTCLEFSILTLENDSYSSICLHVGTSMGHVATFKILPQGERYTVEFLSAFNVEEPPLCIVPINSENGFRASANGVAMGGLRQGQQVHGVLLAVTKSGARIIRPPTGKGHHKSFDETCVSASVGEYHDRGIALICVMDTGKVRIYSIPGLKELGFVNVSSIFDVHRLSESKVTQSGCVVSWTGPNEIGLISVWGTGRTLTERPSDDLYNVQMPVPPRPTISNFQWISGTQHVSPEDFDLLIGGPDRPMSKRMLEEQRLAAAQERQDARLKAQEDPSASSSNSVFGNMAKNLQQRTEGLSLWSDNMDKLEEHSASFADAASKFASQQKKKMLIGGLKKSFF